MKLGETLGGAFKTYAKKPLLFSGLYLIISIPILLLQIFLLGGSIMQLNNITNPAQLGAVFTPLLIVYFVIFFLASIVVGAVTLGALINAASKVLANSKVDFMGPIKFALSKFWAYIILTLRIFWYTLAWVFVLLMIAVPVASIGLQAQTASAVSGVLSVAAFAIGVIAFIRMLKSFLAYYILFDSDNVTPKAALEKSIVLTKGNLWRLIGYMLVLGIIIGIISSILDGFVIAPIVNLMDNFETAITVSSVLSYVVAAILAPIPIIYYFLFYKGLAGEK